MTERLMQRVVDAYNLEAELLDAHDLTSWLGWVDADFRYEVPIPVTAADAASPRHSTRGFLAVETHASVKLWIHRLSPDLVDSAYAENPPPRTRHFVTNVRVQPSDHAERIRVRSNVLLSWCDWNEPPRLAPAERHDVLHDDGRQLRLLQRRVLLDTGIVHLPHLRVLF